VSLKLSLSSRRKAKAQDFQCFSVVEAGGIEPPAGFAPCYEKVIDSPAKSTTFSAFPQADDLPKKSAIDPNNPEKPDRVRSVKGNLRKQ
jgi:hypothetical protein